MLPNFQPPSSTTNPHKTELISLDRDAKKYIESCEPWLKIGRSTIQGQRKKRVSAKPGDTKNNIRYVIGTRLKLVALK